MPSLTALDASHGPRADPLSYPGEIVDASYLWLGSWGYPLRARPGCQLGQWRIHLDGGPLAGTAATVEPKLDLSGALLSAGAEPMDLRHPVVAFGSNAAPAQLRDKFQVLDPVERAIPVTRASLRGLVLAHSPHVSDPGYLPYVLVDGGDTAELDVCVLWLDARQRSCLNATEPNYELVSVAGDRYPLTLESEQAITSYSLYKGRWGALRWPGETAPVVAGSQRQLFAGLNRTGWFPALVGPADPLGQVSRLRAEAGLRLRVRGELAARGFVTPDGWAAGADPAAGGSDHASLDATTPPLGSGGAPAPAGRWFTRRRWLTRRGLNP